MSQPSFDNQPSVIVQLQSNLPSASQPPSVSQPNHLTLSDKPIKVYTRRTRLEQTKHNQESTPDPMSHEIAQVEPASSPQSEPTDPEPVDCPIPDLDLPIALRKGTRSCTMHPIQNHLSHANLSQKFRAFAFALETKSRFLEIYLKPYKF